MKYASYNSKWYLENGSAIPPGTSGDWEHPKSWLTEIKKKDTKNDHFDPIHYMFGVIQPVHILCKNPSSQHNNKVISKKYIMVPNVKIYALVFKHKAINGMQQLLDDYFNPKKNPNMDIIDKMPCGKYAHIYRDIIPCGKYILMHIVNYDNNKIKDKSFKITPSSVNEFRDNTLNIKWKGKDYKLRSFTCHQGPDGNIGHYINYKNIAQDLNDNGWQYISDTHVQDAPVKSLFDYFTSKKAGSEAWEEYTPTIFMYELVGTSKSLMEDVDTYNTNWFETRNWSNQTLSNTNNKAVGFVNSTNGCFFNATIQMLFANRHLATLILHNDEYHGIKLGSSVAVTSTVATPLGSSVAVTSTVATPLGSSVAVTSTVATPLVAGSKPSQITILSWNMMFNCHTKTGIACYNNMIDYINTTKPYIFCAQEASWFFPAMPQSHTVGYLSAGQIERITLNGYNPPPHTHPSKNIAWGGGTDICIIYWNPDYFVVDQDFPLTKRSNSVPDKKRIKRGNIPKSKSTSKWAVKNASNKSNDSRPAIGVRLVPKWDLSKRWIIISMHAMHHMSISQLKSFVNPILDALDYISADKIVLVGDFNELYEDELVKSNLNSINFGKSTKINLKVNVNLSTWKTCCTFGAPNRTFDLFYSNFANAKSSVEEKTNKFLSDHTPILTSIKDTDY